MDLIADLFSEDADRQVRMRDGLGYLELVDILPRIVPDDYQTADWAIARAARESYGHHEVDNPERDRKLIRKLIRREHMSPFEFVEFVFHVRAPIFVARQWMRHRTANIVEKSGRYSVGMELFYRPADDDERLAKVSDETKAWLKRYFDLAESLRVDYDGLRRSGVPMEIARIGLPPSLYTQWFWKCDLRNILNFLKQRCDSHAQAEIREYADAMAGFVEAVCPWTIEALTQVEGGGAESD